MTSEANVALSCGVEQDRKLPTVVIESNRPLFRLDLHLIWEYRELLIFLAWRDLKARYAQTIFGVAWAIMQPLAMMITFTLVFSKFAGLPSDGLPYPLFAYTALVPWAYFSRSFERSAFSVVAESSLVKKTYFPRIIIPISATLAGLLDFAVALLLLFLMMVWYGVPLTWGVLAIPALVGMILVTTLAISLWLAAIFVKYRDIAAATPLLMQVWMFASPIAYPVSLVPQELRLLYGLNPMVGIIEGFRWALLGKESPDFVMMSLSACVVAVVLLGGIICFNRMERTFADVI